MRTRLIVVMALLLPVLARGTEDEQLRQRQSDMLADCAAYYAVAAQRPGIAVAPDTVLQRRSMALVKSASRITNRKIAMLRYRETLQTLRNELATKGTDMEKLDARYREACVPGG